jgi:hypothetical protein
MMTFKKKTILIKRIKKTISSNKNKLMKWLNNSLKMLGKNLNKTNNI